MKFAVILASLLLSIGHFSDAVEGSSFPPDDPPFYTMGWQELGDLSDKQKSDYMNLLLRDLLALPVREKTSEDLEQVTLDNKAWDKFQLEVYDICHRSASKRIVSACQRLENDRLNILESMSVDHNKHMHR